MHDDYGRVASSSGSHPEPRSIPFGRNVEEIDFDRLEGFDIVGVTGMIVQRDRMREILQRLRRLKIFTVVGGAYASVDEAFFEGLCDVLFSGEADEN